MSTTCERTRELKTIPQDGGSGSGGCSAAVQRVFRSVVDVDVARRHSVRPEDEARLSPLGHEHINLLGRYSFAVPESVARGELRPLRNPADGGR